MMYPVELYPDSLVKLTITEDIDEAKLYIYRVTAVFCNPNQRIERIVDNAPEAMALYDKMRLAYRCEACTITIYRQVDTIGRVEAGRPL